MAFAPNLFAICFAMALKALYNALFSGTFTALVYDSLKTEDREDEYLQISANSSQISMLASALGSLASTVQRFLGFAGFYLLSALFEGVSTLACQWMNEPIVTAAQANRARRFLRENTASAATYRINFRLEHTDIRHARSIHPARAGQSACSAHLPADRKAHRIQCDHLGALLPDQDVFAAASH